MKTETLIVGAGLSGLALARQLHREGKHFHILEARDRLGGRVMTETLGDAYFDLGPAWFWLGQPRIAALVDELGLRSFEQYATGDVVFEDAAGHVQRGRGHSSMQGSYRLEGGLAKMIEALARALPPTTLTMSAHVARLSRQGSYVVVETSNGHRVTANRVVFAMPPRVVAEMRFSPELPNGARNAMKGIPTWMAGQAKAVAVYERPFWRNDGLSGDAASRRGPLVEIHDASTHDSRWYALFGFVGIPAHARTDVDLLRAKILQQLSRLFGPDAEHPKALFLKDWAFDPLTATSEDRQPLFEHPRYRPMPALEHLWEERLAFAGAEVASDFGGFLEGALEAAERVASKILGDRG